MGSQLGMTSEKKAENNMMCRNRKRTGAGIAGTKWRRTDN